MLWVGGWWVGGEIEENEAVGMSYRRWVGGLPDHPLTPPP